MIMESNPQLDPISEFGAARGRVLICDDDWSQRELLTLILRKNGFETLDTGLGDECRRYAASEPISAVLLDIDLPDASGLDICEELSDAQSTHQLPIILISGMDQADIVRSARRHGARFFLQKPYDPAAVIALLERALDETSPW
ncbi:response regulator [Blastopirellula sp. JC732]|uniref:Response regulator n=1 Tax=Blastopirellula sediminis TaxID=2894196 RepID=A0A9X1ML25_9BACT|nr:response regulator [Blastopirellula sediminis]MCC9609724.1 response regulator [Blastopirellula sediminis]MCC9628968.1 response regulator [Blastopirellula sediminis]